jgi:hypothetical protein
MTLVKVANRATRLIRRVFGEKSSYLLQGSGLDELYNGIRSSWMLPDRKNEAIQSEQRRWSMAGETSLSVV